MNIDWQLIMHFGYSLIGLLIAATVLHYYNKNKENHDLLIKLEAENQKIKQILRTTTLSTFNIVKSTLWLRYLAFFNSASEKCYQIEKYGRPYKFYYKCTKPAHIIRPKKICNESETDITDEFYLFDPENEFSYKDISLNFQLRFKVYSKDTSGEPKNVRDIVVEIKFNCSPHLENIKNNIYLKDANFTDKRIFDFLNRSSEYSSDDQLSVFANPIVQIVAYDAKTDRYIGSSNIIKYTCHNRHLKIDNGCDTLTDAIFDAISNIYTM